MPKRFFKILFVLALVGMICYAALLFAVRKETFPTFSINFYRNFNENSTLPTESAQQMVEQQEADTNTGEEAGQEQETRGEEAPLFATNDHESGLCPEFPPGLVGPLLVEFNKPRSWNEVTDTTSYSLSLGGRFKPPDCIARQKVVTT